MGDVDLLQSGIVLRHEMNIQLFTCQGEKEGRAM